ncbi:MAG TPA: hypothetical protein VFG43_07650, partial [Geminicoccaceae bacterium]|nr:hypothetical protein [Geminicoccaceae bacterium]
EPRAIAAALRRLLDDPGARAAQRQALAGLRDRLRGPAAASPSRHAARAILDLVAISDGSPGNPPVTDGLIRRGRLVM